ncbi:MAG: GNAT family N-acetyltransferase [Betaproteobacteria bacterium]|nr:GNAT family N-acetyltransferase [Betaproteobacteria bacterium]
MFPDTVETLRLHLRRPVAADAEPIFQTYAQDREVTRYLVWVPHTSIDTTKKFIAVCEDRWMSSVAFPYVITRKEDGHLLGMIEIRPDGHRAGVGYVLARAYWGNGFMPEAIAALVKITLRPPTIYRMEATCDVENKASMRALEKSGFSQEGLLRRYIIHPNISPEPRDSVLYALTK